MSSYWVYFVIKIKQTTLSQVFETCNMPFPVAIKNTEKIHIKLFSQSVRPNGLQDIKNILVFFLWQSVCETSGRVLNHIDTFLLYNDVFVKKLCVGSVVI